MEVYQSGHTSIQVEQKTACFLEPRQLQLSPRMKGRRYDYSDSDYGDTSRDGVPMEASTLLNPHKKLRSLKRGFRWLYPLLALSVVVLVFVYYSLQKRLFSSSNLRLPSNPDGTLRLAIVSDLDKKSRVENDKKGLWKSVMKKGELKRDGQGRLYHFLGGGRRAAHQDQ